MEASFLAVIMLTIEIPAVEPTYGTAFRVTGHLLGALD